MFSTVHEFSDKKSTSEFKTSIFNIVFISYWHEGSRVLCGKNVTNKLSVWHSTRVVKGAVEGASESSRQY